MTIDASLNERLRRITRKHDRMRRNGVVYKVGRDGLIRARPRLIRPQLPVQVLILMVALLIAFKTLLFAQLGAEAYEARLEALRAGSTMDQIGAFLLQKEPVTQYLADMVKAHLPQT